MMSLSLLLSYHHCYYYLFCMSGLVGCLNSQQLKHCARKWTRSISWNECDQTKKKQKANNPGKKQSIYNRKMCANLYYSLRWDFKEIVHTKINTSKAIMSFPLINLLDIVNTHIKTVNRCWIEKVGQNIGYAAIQTEMWLRNGKSHLGFWILIF